MKYDVFISYSSHDQKVVEGLCAYLEARKIRCFVAYRDIPKSVVWAKAIVEALEASRMMVVVFSNHFNNSDQVDREIELASEDKKPILTFRITDDAFKGAKKYYLKNINWIDAFPNPSEVFGAVAENISKLLGIPATSTPSTKIDTSSTSDSYNREWEEWNQARAQQKQNRKTKQNNSSGKTYKVGDYYNENGKEGVVFFVDSTGHHGKILSLKQAECQWAIESEAKHDIGCNNTHDGAVNMNRIKQIDGWEIKFPAFRWCASLGEDWYLPASDEILFFTSNNAIYNAVNDGLNRIEATPLLKPAWGGFFFRGYWSSTEKERLFGCRHAYFVDVREGAENFSKETSWSVRAVAAF